MDMADDAITSRDTTIAYLKQAVKDALWAASSLQVELKEGLKEIYDIYEVTDDSPELRILLENSSDYQKAQAIIDKYKETT